jgi:regulator of ribonuclease activity A
MGYKTSDICDHFGAELQVALPGLNHYGGVTSFHGQIVTLRVHQDFSLVKQTLATAGDHRVLVIDGGGFLGCALLGDSLAAMAHENAWAGAIVNGCVRDSAALSEIEFGVLALNTCPVRPAQTGAGETGIPVTFAGTTFRPGDYLYADEDGVVTSPTLYP